MIGTNDNAAANDGEVMTLEEAAALCRVSRDVVYRPVSGPGIVRGRRRRTTRRVRGWARGASTPARRGQRP